MFVWCMQTHIILYNGCLDYLARVIYDISRSNCIWRVIYDIGRSDCIYENVGLIII